MNRTSKEVAVLKLIITILSFCTAREAMRRGISPIIIDNTNTRCIEMKPYVAAVSNYIQCILAVS